MNIIHIMLKIDDGDLYREVQNMNIKTLREKRGFRQEDLAKELNVDRSAVAKWETGCAVPKADRLPQIAKVLSCSIEDLYNSCT